MPQPAVKNLRRSSLMLRADKIGDLDRKAGPRTGIPHPAVFDKGGLLRDAAPTVRTGTALSLPNPRDRKLLRIAGNISICKVYA